MKSAHVMMMSANDECPQNHHKSGTLKSNSDFYERNKYFLELTLEINVVNEVNACNN